jgi:putative GTP pyrophosphokinase
VIVEIRCTRPPMPTRNTPTAAPPFPGGSKTRVNRAGDRVRSGEATPEDLQAIEEWRAAHRGVLNTFQSILRQRARSARATVAQRHKRKRTIFDKLQRLPGMKLSRMDDVAGCRLIFKTQRELHAFRARFHKARFKHKRRHPDDPDKYDYIKAPKETGYRGIHDVYEYDVNSDVGKPLTGLYVEIQYRTLVQHAWATAVEVIGFITESQPKFRQGDKRYEDAMALASEILARGYEGQKGPHPELSDGDLVARFFAAEKEIRLIETLRSLNAADRAVSTNRNAILIFSGGKPLEVRTFRDATEALRALFTIEKEMPECDIVLVRADTSDEIRLAFKNYFSDARDFIKLVEKGCAKLASGARSPSGKPPRRRARC